MKKRSFIKLITVFACAFLLALSVVFATQINSVYAYTFKDVPTGDNAIGNIYAGVDDDGKPIFNKNYLNALARKVKDYTDIDGMVADAEDGITKTSTDFGDVVVDFGEYTYEGNTYQLTWIPAYLSQSDVDQNGDGKNDAILTFWLAYARDRNDNVSQQDPASFSNGTYNTSSTKTINGEDVACNSYDYSYIRNYILNVNAENCSNHWGYGTKKTFPEAELMTKFTQLTNGNLSDYIVTPSNVDWQKNAAYMKNDPLWNGTGSSVKGTAANYPSAWLNDKLWLPSIYEVVDRSLGANSTKTEFTVNGGLWRTSLDRRQSSYAFCFTRSAGRTTYNYVYGALGLSATVENNGCARPAFHLNLSVVAEEAVNLCDHEWGEWETVTPATCTTAGTQKRVCNLCGNEDDPGTIEIDPTAHNWGAWSQTQDPTCTVDGERQRICANDSTHIETEPITAPGHTSVTDNAVQPDCTNTGLTEGSHCSVCNSVITAQEVVPANGHTLVTDKAVEATCTTAGKTAGSHCSVCKEVITAQEEVPAQGHTTVTDEAIAATCTTPGKTAGSHCSVCDTVLTAQTVTDALGHDWNDGTITTQPTCMTEGVKTFTCKRDGCGATRTESVDKIDHTPEIDAAVPPTCTTAGKKAGSHCKVCNTVIVAQEVDPATGHIWSTEWNNDETHHWHDCTYGCGTKNGNAAHVYIWVVDVPATVTTTGVKHEECKCGVMRNENTEIPVQTCLHTNKTHVTAIAATCVSTGRVEYWYCNDCEKNLNGSDLELDTVTTPVDPEAHSFTNYVSDGNATCLEDGTKSALCDHGCGNKDTVEDTNSALGHNFGEWVVTTEPTFTEDGLKRRECSRCDVYEEEVITKKDLAENELTLELATEFVYGEAVTPVISAKYGEVAVKWYDTTTGEELAAKPVNAGSYKLVARVEENLEDGYTGVEKEVEFTIAKRAITVAINGASSVAGDDLEELSATITSGSIVGEIPYTLSTNADKETMGEYTITGVCTNDNYNITFVDGVYIVSKKVQDDNGEIDLPVDINVEFKVTQSQTTNDYSELNGLKTGYWAQLWYRNDDGTLGDEFTDKMNCILTLKIPTDIIEGIRGGEEINREKIAAGLSVYYVNNGNLTKVEAFTIAQKEDESWIVKFNYNEQFRAEVVFNAEGVELPAPEEPEQAGIPWWVWLLVGLVAVAIAGVVIVIIVVAKKKGNGGNGGDTEELKAQLAEQGEKIDELLGRDDGGFNTPVELDENGNVIFK